MPVKEGEWSAAELDLLKQRIRDDVKCIPIANELGRLTTDVRLMAARLGTPLEGDETLLQERAVATYQRHRENMSLFSSEDPERQESYREYIEARRDARSADDLLPP